MTYETSASETPPTTGTRIARWYYRGLSVAGVVLALLIGVGKYLERVTLPDCDSTRANEALMELGRSVDVNIQILSDVQQLPAAGDDVQCRATATLPQGGALDIGYRFYWQDGVVKTAFTSATAK